MSNHLNELEIFNDKNVQPSEVINLMASVNWGSEQDYDLQLVQDSISAYPIIAYARDATGLLVGYVSAFTDGAFSTFIGELVVRPPFQRQGIGSKLLELVVSQCRGVPVYATPFKDTENFFLDRGFRIPKRAMTVVSTRNAA